MSGPAVASPSAPAAPQPAEALARSRFDLRPLALMAAIALAA